MSFDLGLLWPGSACRGCLRGRSVLQSLVSLMSGQSRHIVDLESLGASRNTWAAVIEWLYSKSLNFYSLLYSHLQRKDGK